MSVDLVKRFRGHEERLRKAGLVTCEDYKEAADRIEELEDEVDYLQGVLEIYKKQVDDLQKIIYDMSEVNE